MSPVWAGLASALLLWVAFPPIGWSGFAWFALVPLFLLVRSERSPWAIGFGAWLGGLLFWLLAIRWVRLTDESAWLAWLVMGLALSFWWPVFLGLARIAERRLNLPLLIAAPILWVGLEHVRVYILSGFPWYYLAHTQHKIIPLIQIADVSGSLGISLLIAMVNAWGVDLLTRPLLRPTPRGARLARAQVSRGLLVLGLLAATLGYGAARLGAARFRPGPRVALLQSNLIQRYKNSAEPRDILAAYERLVLLALQQEPAERPDLIVWPETAYPWGFVALDARLEPAAFASQILKITPDGTVADWLAKRDAVSTHLHSWTDTMQVPMLVGSVTYDFHRDGLSKFNSAILFEPGKPAVQSYHKIHLVPFGEYVPLIKTFPWLTVLTPYRGVRVPSLSFGREPVSLRLGPYRLAAAICFEDTVPQVVRSFFTDLSAQPDVLLNLSNDGWFHGSEEHDMHLAVSIFRAIENRVPLARAANTGVSALVDGNGRVLAFLPKLREGVVSRVVPLDDRVSLYSSWGDWLGLSCLAVTIGLPILALVRGRPRKATGARAK